MKRPGWWPRAAVVAVFAGAAVGAIGAGVAALRLASIAEWAIESSLPGVRARLAGLVFENPGRLVARGLELRGRSDGALLLSLKGGAVEFSVPGLLRREVSRVELLEPHMVITPRALEILLPEPAAPARGETGRGGGGWRLGVVSCRYGTFEVAGFGEAGCGAAGKFMLGGGAHGQELVLWDVQSSGGAAAVGLDLVEISGLDGLARGRVERVRLRGGRLEFTESGAGPPGGGGGGGGRVLPDLELGEVVVEGLRIQLPASVAMPSALAFTLNTRLQSIPLGRVAGALAAEKQFVELEDLEILSPLDPLATVVSIRAVGCEWTLAGLAERRIESLTITSPTLHVMEDLFWTMESGGDGGGAADWTVGRLTIVDGRLVIGSSGRAALGLPLRFRSTARNVSLSSLASLQVDIALEIPPRSYEFPSYELEFSTAPGELRLAYPPESGAKNLVGTVRLPRIRWRQLEAAGGWLTVTFDGRGINGLFGAECYRGYLNGGFSFLFQPGAPWIGWAAGTQLDLRRLTHTLTPGRLLLDGRLDIELEADASGPEIQRVKGALRTSGGGRVHIPKLDELLAAVPKEWPAVRQSGAQIALRTLRDFEFDRGSGDLSFAGGRGRLGLELRGPSGSRTVEVVFHGNHPGADARGGRR